MPPPFLPITPDQQNFFRTVKALVHQYHAEGPRNESTHRYGDAEKELTELFHQAQHAFRVALCDSFNTPVALDVIRDVVSRTNVYINSRNVNSNLDVSVVERIARWVGGVLRMFGLGEGESNEIGWGQEVAEGEGNVNVSVGLCSGLQNFFLHSPVLLARHLSVLLAPLVRLNLPAS